MRLSSIPHALLRLVRPKVINSHDDLAKALNKKKDNTDVTTKSAWKMINIANAKSYYPPPQLACHHKALADIKAGVAPETAMTGMYGTVSAFSMAIESVRFVSSEADMTFSAKTSLDARLSECEEDVNKAKAGWTELFWRHYDFKGAHYDQTGFPGLIAIQLGSTPDPTSLPKDQAGLSLLGAFRVMSQIKTECSVKDANSKLNEIFEHIHRVPATLIPGEYAPCTQLPDPFTLPGFRDLPAAAENLDNIKEFVSSLRNGPIKTALQGRVRKYTQCIKTAQEHFTQQALTNATPQDPAGEQLLRVAQKWLGLPIYGEKETTGGHAEAADQKSARWNENLDAEPNAGGPGSNAPDPTWREDLPPPIPPNLPTGQASRHVFTSLAGFDAPASRTPWTGGSYFGRTAPTIDIRTMNLEEAFASKFGNRTVSQQTLHKLDAVFLERYGIHLNTWTSPPQIDAAYLRSPYGQTFRQLDQAGDELARITSQLDRMAPSPAKRDLEDRLELYRAHVNQAQAWRRDFGLSTLLLDECFDDADAEFMHLYNIPVVGDVMHEALSRMPDPTTLTDFNDIPTAMEDLSRMKEAMRDQAGAEQLDAIINRLSIYEERIDDAMDYWNDISRHNMAELTKVGLSKEIKSALTISDKWLGTNRLGETMQLDLLPRGRLVDTIHAMYLIKQATELEKLDLEPLKQVLFETYNIDPGSSTIGAVLARPSSHSPKQETPSPADAIRDITKVQLWLTSTFPDSPRTVVLCDWLASVSQRIANVDGDRADADLQTQAQQVAGASRQPGPGPASPASQLHESFRSHRSSFSGSLLSSGRKPAPEQSNPYDTSNPSGDEGES